MYSGMLYLMKTMLFYDNKGSTRKLEDGVRSMQSLTPPSSSTEGAVSSCVSTGVPKLQSMSVCVSNLA